MIDTRTLENSPNSSKPFQKGDLPRRIGRTKGGLNSKLHVISNEHGKPLVMLLSEGQMSDRKGAALLLPHLPKARTLLGDRVYDSQGFRKALIAQGITPCIPSQKDRKTQAIYDQALYKKRHKIENLFARLKDWRRVAMRYDRCAHTFFSAICMAASLVFYLI